MMAEEMCGGTRPGGLVVVSYTLGYGAFGGHEMGLTHYLGVERARRLYARRDRHPPENHNGRSLLEVGGAEGLAWARATRSAELLAALPRYHPRWAWWLVRVPVLREILVSNLVLVVRAREPRRGSAQDRPEDSLAASGTRLQWGGTRSHSHITE